MKKYLVVMMALLVSGSVFALQKGDTFEGAGSDSSKCELRLEEVSRDALVVTYAMVGPFNSSKHSANKETFNRYSGAYKGFGRTVVAYSNGNNVELFLDAQTGTPVRMHKTRASGGTHITCSVLQAK